MVSQATQPLTTMIRILSTARAFPTDGSADERSKWNTEFEEGFLKQIYPDGAPTQNIFENNPLDVRTIQLAYMRRRELTVRIFHIRPIDLLCLWQELVSRF